MSKIQWTETTWNVVTGCTRLSAGCDRCYASTLHNRRYKANVRAAMKSAAFFGDPVAEVIRDMRKNNPRHLPAPDTYDTPFAQVKLHPERLEIPLRRKKPTLYFTCSMGDLWHEAVPLEFIAEVYAVMVAAYWHTFQVLTKRPGRRRAALQDDRFRDSVAKRTAKHIDRMKGERRERAISNLRAWIGYAANNTWEGTSVEDQESADRRILELLATPAAVRFLSCEPLLGPLNIWPYIVPVEIEGVLRGLDWVIVGGESGPGARPCDVEWIRDIVRQCRSAGVAPFVKQLGRNPYGYGQFEHEDNEGYGVSIGRDSGRRLRDSHGGDWSEWPEDLRVREMPR